MAGPRKVFSLAALVADAVGIFHFLLANVLIVIGELTSVFQYLSEKFSGMAFVFKYLDAPMYAVLAPLIGTIRYDNFQTILLGELVIVGSSFVYGLFAYFIVRLIKAIWI